MKEIWESIVGFEGLYEVSNLGHVKALIKKYEWGRHKAVRVKQEHCLMASLNDGYPQVVLWRGGKGITRRVHRLVGKAFIANPSNKPEINHKNGIKVDNRVENLEWVTCQENINHSNKTGLAKVLRRGEIGTAKLVLDLQTGIFYDCLKDAAEAKNLNYGTLVNRMCGFAKNNTSLIYV